MHFNDLQYRARHILSTQYMLVIIFIISGESLIPRPHQQFRLDVLHILFWNLGDINFLVNTNNSVHLYDLLFNIKLLIFYVLSSTSVLFTFDFQSNTTTNLYHFILVPQASQLTQSLKKFTSKTSEKEIHLTTSG